MSNPCPLSLSLPPSVSSAILIPRSLKTVWLIHVLNDKKKINHRQRRRGRMCADKIKNISSGPLMRTTGLATQTDVQFFHKHFWPCWVKPSRAYLLLHHQYYCAEFSRAVPAMDQLWSSPKPWPPTHVFAGKLRERFSGVVFVYCCWKHVSCNDAL